jgi:hypothetical protein
VNVPLARRRALRRAVLYGALLLALGGVAAYFHHSPQRDLDGLVATITAVDGERRFFRHEAAVIGFHAHRGWTLTLYVGDTSRFAPADFLVLRRLDGVLDGELLTNGDAAQQSMRAVRLEGASLDAYLATCGLDLSGLDALHQRRLAAAGK